jgi:glycosyltransferase involved in cell wall biosynthesis
LRHHGCGIAIAPNDTETLVDTVRRWANDPAAMAELGANARTMLEAHFSRRQGLERWRALLDEVADPHRDL